MGLRPSRQSRLLSGGTETQKCQGPPEEPLATPRAKRAEGGDCRPLGVISETKATNS